MKTCTNESFDIVAYGSASDAFSGHWRKRVLDLQLLNNRCKPSTNRLFVSFSQDINQEFIKLVGEYNSSHWKLLVVNEGFSSDVLISNLLALKIRTEERFYVADVNGRFSAENNARSLAISLIKRITASHNAMNDANKILDAKIVGNSLHVISPDFRRLDVPIAKISELSVLDRVEWSNFEIDEDGSFLYWPKQDIHLGWEQLEQIVNPEALRKAKQKNLNFNIRFGEAVKKLREQAGLKRTEISALSEKQLRRIESGESRLTANASEALAKAHHCNPDEYLKKLSDALD
jgi:hypothetical protein